MFLGRDGGVRKVSIQEKHGRGEHQGIRPEKGDWSLEQSRDPVQEDPEQPG